MHTDSLHQQHEGNKPVVILAYSGGLDTSVAIKWIEDHYGYDVVALGIDVGEGKDLDHIKEKAIRTGAKEAIVIDGKKEFAEEYILPALKANCLYEGKYPLSSAISRPLISKKLVEAAHAHGAVAVAHGCTGKGNDQVRFDVSIQALDPSLKVVAPVREWGMNRDEEIAYAMEKGIDVPVNTEKPFSIDANIWGRACEAGVLEDTWAEAPEEAFEWTAPVSMTPDQPEYVDIEFKNGVPVALNGEEMDLVPLIEKLNLLGGAHGVGRIDHVENRLVGIKSREVYENAAALILIQAHKELELLTLPREVTKYKTGIDEKMTELIYEGLWFSPLKKALEAFIDETQKVVSGTIKVKLFKGMHTVVARKSPNSLYNADLATYSKGDAFDHKAAEGFIKLFGLSTKVYADVHTEKGGAAACQNSGEDVSQKTQMNS
ncbi:argininosuccinate synthase [Alteribacter natronophilus]|uniref:argininosuccinate synthase n=1 Tax=Alteribacter natronophilus TaxID=2583810 RepID=UPI00110F3361|nr:argininosuccinate synthase [Alteribacter natronophilus]TMW74047.1 argininosuccinate synthase [Alteribacter natronophilus]